MSPRVKALAGGFFLLVTSVIFIRIYTSYPKTDGHTENDETKNSFDVLDFNDVIGELNKETPLELVFNENVDFYIQLYLNERKDAMETMLSRADLYFPIIESYLDAHSLPLELKYIAIVESGLNPVAKSKSGAVGLWQFLYNTCALLGLEVNSYIDERRDVFASTDAACKYLEYLYTTFKDWNLAMAAYNGGPGEVRKAIERSGGKTDYWEIQPYLSKQAQNYVPAFIAFNYLFENSQQLGFQPQKPDFTFADIDSVKLKEAAHLSVISSYLNIPKKQLEYLNPMYTKGFIPATKDANHLILPKKKLKAFFKAEHKIYREKPPKTGYLESIETAGDTKGKVCLPYVVKKGDFFHKLALEHNCTIENIKAWNNLSSNAIYPGQKLKIWVSPL